MSKARLVLPTPKCEARVLSVPEHDARVSNSKRNGRVSAQHEVHVSTKKHEMRVQHCMSSRHKMPKSPHPQGFEASFLDASSMDLRDYLTRKRSIHQIVS